MDRAMTVDPRVDQIVRVISDDFGEVDGTRLRELVASVLAAEAVEGQDQRYVPPGGWCTCRKECGDTDVDGPGTCKMGSAFFSADAVEGDRHRQCDNLDWCVRPRGHRGFCRDAEQEERGTWAGAGGGVEPSREDRPTTIGEHAILTLQEDVDTFVEDQREREARYEELLDALEEALKEPVPRAYARIVRLVREARA
jgi:hypothetical protein